MTTGRRTAALALLVLGVAALGLGAAAIALAAPTTLHCARSTQTCQWQQPGLFGRTHEATLSLGSLHDSRVEYGSHRVGISTRWVVTGPGGTLELGAPTDSSERGQTYEQLAHAFQHFLAHSKPERFDAELATTNVHGWLILALAGALAAGGGVFLVRRVRTA